MGIDSKWLRVFEEKGLIETPAPTKPAGPAKPKPGIDARQQVTVELLGLVLRSEANIRSGARAYMGRKSAVKAAIAAGLDGVPVLPFRLPTPVVLTRLGGRKLDDDNLQSAFKVVRDCIAAWLGVDDGDTASVRWIYRQRPAWRAGIRITIG